MKYLFVLCFVAACGDDSTPLSDSGSDVSIADATISDAAIPDAGLSDGGIDAEIVTPRETWQNYARVGASACSCTADMTTVVCIAGQATDAVLNCFASATSNPESSDYLLCLDRRLSDLEACIEAGCDEESATACIEQFERRVESCPMLSEAINDELSACE